MEKVKPEDTVPTPVQPDVKRRTYGLALVLLTTVIVSPDAVLLRCGCARLSGPSLTSSCSSRSFCGSSYISPRALSGLLRRYAQSYAPVTCDDCGLANPRLWSLLCIKTALQVWSRGW